MISAEFRLSTSVLYTAVVYVQEIILKRAGDLAEALYSMPRQPLPPPPPPQTPSMNPSSAFNSYTGQFSIKDPTQAQWDDGWSHRYPAIAY